MAIFNTVPPLAAGAGIKFDGERISTAAAPRNLLDNSDFRNPVNQRGQSRYKNVAYTIDRWRFWDSAAELSVKDNGIATTGILWQHIEPKAFRPDQKHTIAVMASDGTLEVHAGLFSSHLGGPMCWCDIEETGKLHFCLGAGHTYVWAALYEGEYTVETLPEYQPKGYATELAECQRYYYRISALQNYAPLGIGIASYADRAQISRHVPNMRIDKPTFSYNGTLQLHNYGLVIDVTDISADQYSSDAVRLNCAANCSSAVGKPVALRAKNDPAAYLDFSADL